VLPAVRKQQCFDDCPLDDPQFVELAEQASTMPFKERTLTHHVANKCKRQHRKREATTDTFIVKATLPPKLSYWVSHWARNPAGMPKPIREDEFGHLDIGDLDVWLWSRTVAPDTHKDAFITSLWSIFLMIGRWEELVDGANWALPIANHLHNNVLTCWVWQDGSDTNPVDPSLLARWLGTYTGVTPDRARDFLKPYTRRSERDMYYSHTAQATQNRVQTKREWKTLMASMEGPSTTSSIGEPSSSASTHPVRLAA